MYFYAQIKIQQIPDLELLEVKWNGNYMSVGMIDATTSTSGF